MQVLPPGQRPAAAAKVKAEKPTPKPAKRPAKRFGTSSMMLGTCKKGHALTTRNSYVNGKGKRVCSLCNLI